MTKDGFRALVNFGRISPTNASVVGATLVALVVGILLDSPVGRVNSFVIAGSGAAFLLFRARAQLQRLVKGQVRKHTKERVYNHSPDLPMKTLLFDDYQGPSGGKYHVKEVVESEETVVPSTKLVQPVIRTVKEEKIKPFEIGDFFDFDSDIYLTDLEPRTEFNFLLRKTLSALREVLFAHSVAFFWTNNEKRQLVLEAKATDSQNFASEKRYPLESDIVSQVAREGKPRFHGRVTPVSEKELVFYYQSTEYIKSIVAVPVFFADTPNTQTGVGVLVADSKAEDAFGPETFGLLGKFTKLISALIKSYTGKHDLLLDSELLTSLRRVQDRIKVDPSEYTVLTSLAEEANRLVSWDFLTIVMYGEEKQGWILQKVINKGGQPYVTPDQIIDFPVSVIGQVIRTNKVGVIEDLSEDAAVRFNPDEPFERTGSFLCVPISSFNRCYGALTLESRKRANFSGSEVETVYRLVESAAAALEVLYMNDLVKEYVIIDQLTGSFKQRHFLTKLGHEVQRADEFGNDLALVSLEIDNKDNLCDRYGREGYEAVLNQIAKLVRSQVRPYDVVGLLDGDRLGVLHINMPASEAYLWAEKVRKQIASHIISLAGKSFSVTISAGVCGLMDGMAKDDLIDGTAQVLHRAVDGGGNLVQIF